MGNIFDTKTTKQIIMFTGEGGHTANKQIHADMKHRHICALVNGQLVVCENTDVGYFELINLCLVDLIS